MDGRATQAASLVVLLVVGNATGGCAFKGASLDDLHCPCVDGYVCNPASGKSPQCSKAGVGDGVVDTGERCDDGNREAGDGCANGDVEEGWSCENGAVPDAFTKYLPTDALTSHCEMSCDLPVNDCIAPTCDDETVNADETDIDCGGTCGATCELFSACGDGGDCASTICSLTDDPEKEAPVCLPWEYTNFIKAPMSDDLIQFGGSVAMDGDFLVAGAPNEMAGFGSGYVHGYRRTERGKWEVDFEASYAETTSFAYGTLVSTSGDRLALTYNAFGPFEGRTYARTDGTWAFVATIQFNAEPFDLALRGDVLIARTIDEDFQIQVWHADGAMWTAEFPPVAKASSMSFDGTHLVVGHPAAGEGDVKVFLRNGPMSWTVETEPTSTDSEAGAETGFGTSVAVFGSWLMVTAMKDKTVDGDDVGAVYWFKWEDDAWTLKTKLNAPVANRPIALDADWAAYATGPTDGPYDLVVAKRTESDTWETSIAVASYIPDLQQTTFKPVPVLSGDTLVVGDRLDPSPSSGVMKQSPGGNEDIDSGALHVFEAAP